MDQKATVLYLHMKLFLFGYVKRNLMGYRAENLCELLVRIQVIVRAIPGEILIEVFLEWMKRLQQSIDMNGEFLGRSKSHQYIIIHFNRWIGLCYIQAGTP
jgi:hypothetical protein